MENLVVFINVFWCQSRRVFKEKSHTANVETSNWALRENDLFLLHLHSLMECFILPLSFSLSHSFFSPLKMSKMHIPPFRSHFSGCFFLIMKHWLESAANLLNVTKMFLQRFRCLSHRFCALPLWLIYF